MTHTPIGMPTLRLQRERLVVWLDVLLARLLHGSEFSMEMVHTALVFKFILERLFVEPPPLEQIRKIAVELWDLTRRIDGAAVDRAVQAIQSTRCTVCGGFANSHNLGFPCVEVARA